MEFSQVVASVAILVVAVAAALRYARTKAGADRDVFLAFAPFALLGFFTFTPDPERYYTSPWVLAVAYVQPVLFVRLVRNIGYDPRWPMVIAAVGGIASVALAIRNPDSFVQGATPSVALLVASVAAFLVPNAWAGTLFARKALRSAGVTQVRLAWSSLAAFLFIVSMTTYSLPRTSGYGIIVDAISLALAGSFLLGFAPPSWVQRAWRASAYVQFDKATERIPDDAPEDEFIARLLASTRGLLDTDAIRFSDHISTRPQDLSAPTGMIGERAYLVATFRTARLFPEEDQRTLNALAGHCMQQLQPRERLRQEEEARKSAEEQAAFKASFLRHFGHEVANPLSPIRLQVKLLLPTATPEQMPRFEVIQRSVDRIDEIIQDVSGVAKAIDPRAPREIVDLDLSALVHEAALTYTDGATRNNCTLQVNGSTAVKVKADRSRLAQVVDNLYSNAIKYSPGGGPIKISVNPDGNGVLMTFQDSGLGFDADQGARLFRTYSRVHREVAPGIPGSGLGLYLVQEVAHAHGGWAKATSDGPGKGSTFSVWLPREPPSAVQVGGFRT